MTGDQLVATSRSDGCVFEAWVRNDGSKRQIISDARESVNNQTRVDKVEERPSTAEDPSPFGPLQAAAPIGFMVLMIFHLATIVLMTAEMPFFIVLALKNDRLDQTWKIVWVVLFAVLAMLVAPVYWYLHVWRRPQPDGKTESITGSDPRAAI